MLAIGIESTAHTLGIGIVKDGTVLSNEKCVYSPEFEGIVPRKAAEYHEKNFEEVLSSALSTAKVKPSEIDLVAFSQGPGLGACLRIGCVAAKSLSLTLGKPIIGVNHCAAHIEISKHFTGALVPLIVYVSGGNTQIILKQKERYHVVGETLDIGMGNLIDVFARSFGEKKAHGGVIEQYARSGKYVKLPYVIKGMNFSFTGLLTDLQKKIENGKYSKEDLCFSLQEHAFAMVTEASERALCLSGKQELIVCGGVAQNKRFQEMLQKMCLPHKCKFGVAPNEFNADNGAMIAYTGALMHEKGVRMKIEDCAPRQRFRVDEVIF